MSEAWRLAEDIERITCKRIEEAVKEELIRMRLSTRFRSKAASFHDPHAATELALLIEHRMARRR